MAPPRSDQLSTAPLSTVDRPEVEDLRALRRQGPGLGLRARERLGTRATRRRVSGTNGWLGWSLGFLDGKPKGGIGGHHFWFFVCAGICEPHRFSWWFWVFFSVLNTTLCVSLRWAAETVPTTCGVTYLE